MMTKGEYFMMRRANGDVRTRAVIAAEYETLAADVAVLDAPPAETTADTAAKVKAVADHDAVNAWLTALKNGTTAQRAQFEVERRKTFAEQKTAAGVV